MASSLEALVQYAMYFGNWRLLSRWDADERPAKALPGRKILRTYLPCRSELFDSRVKMTNDNLPKHAGVF